MRNLEIGKLLLSRMEGGVVGLHFIIIIAERSGVFIMFKSLVFAGQELLIRKIWDDRHR